MTIYDTAHPLFFATLFQAWFQGTDSQAAGCPSNAELPILLMEAAMKPPLPSAVIVAVENGSMGAKRVMQISVQLFNGIKATSSGAAEVEWQTSFAKVSGWLVQMERRMRQMNDIVDGATTIKGWKSWFAAQPNDLRDGWRAMKFVFHGTGSPKCHGEERLINTFSFDLHYALI